MSAASVTASTNSNLEAGSGSTPRAALQSSVQFSLKDIIVRPVPHLIAKRVGLATTI